MVLGFQLSAGSIPGRKHVGSGNLLVGKNNQDAFQLKSYPDCIIATVHDGCSAGSHSEVGAKLASRLLETLLYQAVTTGSLSKVETTADARSLLNRVRKKLLGRITQIASLMVPSRRQLDEYEAERPFCRLPLEEYEDILHQYFLFTTVGLVVTTTTTIIFSVGDGVYGINGQVNEIGPFPANAPPYSTYALLHSSFDEKKDLLSFAVHATLPNSMVESAMIATDGLNELLGKSNKILPGKNTPLGNIEALWSDDSFFDGDQCELLTPWLRQVNSEVVRLDRASVRLERQYGLLMDDTTVITMRRKEGR